MSPSIIDRLKQSSSSKKPDSGSYFAFLHFAICISCPHAIRQQRTPKLCQYPIESFIKAFAPDVGGSIETFSAFFLPSSHVDIIPRFPQLVISTTPSLPNWSTHFQHPRCSSELSYPRNSIATCSYTNRNFLVFQHTLQRSLRTSIKAPCYYQSCVTSKTYTSHAATSKTPSIPCAT